MPCRFWVSLIFGAIAQAIHFFVPETRSTCILDKVAKRRRQTNELANLKDPEEANIYGPNEMRGSFWERLSWKEVRTLLWRPYRFLFTEPIVGLLSLYSGFSDALIFTGLDAFGMVMKQWDFGTVAIGLSFIALLIGYFIAYALFAWRYYYDRRAMAGDASNIKPERRLFMLLFTAPLLPIGLFAFGATSFGPRFGIPWIAPLITLGPVGIANFAIYMATIDYMVAAYGPYAASATGGNGFCRDLLAGIAALYARPFYNRIQRGTKYQLATPTWILGTVAVFLAIPAYLFFFHGEFFRKRSPFAQSLAEERDEKRPERLEAITRHTTPSATPNHSRSNSPGRVEKTSGKQRYNYNISKRHSGVESMPASRRQSLTDDVERQSLR